MLNFTPGKAYEKNEQRINGLDATPCIICGKGIVEPWRNTVHVYFGWTLVTEAEAQTLDGNGDLGMWPIGNDCLHKRPELLPYVIRLVAA
jgi:hypothetical protein